MPDTTFLTPTPDAPFHWDTELAPGNTPAPSLGDHHFTLHTQTAKDLCDTPDDDRHELLGPLIQHAGRTIIVGDTGEGKTTLALQLIRHILDGTTFLDIYPGAGQGRALILDLEQGVRSVKRALRDANLHNRTDVDLALVPDGLALDRDDQHILELDRVLNLGAYTIVTLDPYYKAHQADEPNAERPIIDLMRKLDALRARHGFALILPAHPRKEAVGSSGPRRLTIHDIAGSGAITRGAEIVIAIERVAQGYARLRYLKDRDSDLPVGQAWHLLYNRDTGYTRDPKDTQPDRDYAGELATAAADGAWRTVKELRILLKASETTIRETLERLVSTDTWEYQQGPPGRIKTAKCYRSKCASSQQMHLDAHHAHPGQEGGSASVHPLSSRDSDARCTPSPPTETTHTDADSDAHPPQDLTERGPQGADDDIPF